MVSKKQKLQSVINNEAALLVIFILIIVGLFAFLSPKISSLLFPFKRQAILNDFISKTKMAGRIDAKDYWKFREFYSPGSFTFAKDGIAKSLSENATRQIGINYNSKLIDSTFLFFSSDRLDSLDMLTKQEDLNKIIDLEQIPKKNIIFRNKNCLIYKVNTNTVRIAFLLNMNDMQKVNGISDYLDSQSSKGEDWFNVTSLKTN